MNWPAWQTLRPDGGFANPFLIHGGLPYGAMFGAPGAASGGI